MNNKQKIIIDCDPGIDDFAAILFAIKLNAFDLLGITTVRGNCSLSDATNNALKTVELASEKEYKVYSGCEKPLGVDTLEATYVHGNNGFGGIEYEKSKYEVQDKTAIDYLIEQVNLNPNEITIVAIGPLTNIASCINKDKDFATKVKRLVIMGAAEHTGNVLPTSEFNFYADALAADIVLKANFSKIDIIDLDVTKKATLNPLLEQFLINHSDNKLAKFWYDITRVGAAFDREKNHVDGSIINDAVTIAYLLKPELIKMKNIDIKVSLDDDICGHTDMIDNEKSHISVSYDILANDFLKYLFITIFPEYQSELEDILK